MSRLVRLGIDSKIFSVHVVLFGQKGPPLNCSSDTHRKSKSIVRHSRSKRQFVCKVCTSASTSGVSHDVVELKDMVELLLLDKQTSPSSAPLFGSLSSNTIANQRRIESISPPRSGGYFIMMDLKFHLRWWKLNTEVAKDTVILTDSTQKTSNLDSQGVEPVVTCLEPKRLYHNPYRSKHRRENPQNGRPFSFEIHWNFSEYPFEVDECLAWPISVQDQYNATLPSLEKLILQE
ncbi:hypothetical protein Tco_0478418 [Tanacetum coccineum]